ncbi:MAG: FAD-dependent monooxygenase [Anaerolineae bacterium]|nr:FAD-dependent monooxygenase [Phycisphaerae bacterium]
MGSFIVSSDRPIVVVGAGPGGSIAASLLARAGLPTIMIEQHRFPRDKVCGECLSAVGIEVLDRVGARDAVARLKAVALERAMIHTPNGATVELQLPSRMWGVSRRQLDRALLDHAKTRGVRVIQPARCERIEHNQVVIRDLTSNRVEEIHTRCVIVADGKGSPTHDLGIKAHFSGVEGPRNAIELFGVDGHYGGLAPVEDEQWNASFSVPAFRVRQFRGDLDAMFAAIVEENETLRARMLRAHRASDWLASPLPRSPVARDWLENQIPVGNAAASLEPIGGEGMGLAMRSAELAAHEIIAAHRAKRAIDIVSLRRAYRDLWCVRSLACRVAAMIVSRPWLANFLAGAIDGREALPRAIMRFIGKGRGASMSNG